MSQGDILGGRSQKGTVELIPSLHWLHRVSAKSAGLRVCLFLLGPQEQKCLRGNSKVRAWWCRNSGCRFSRCGDFKCKMIPRVESCLQVIGEICYDVGVAVLSLLVFRHVIFSQYCTSKVRESTRTNTQANFSTWWRSCPERLVKRGTKSK